MKFVIVIFLAGLILGTCFYFRQNPDQAVKVQEAIRETQLPKIDPNKDLLLPDMMIVPPKELYIAGTGSKKGIRFNTTFANIGKGPLEIIGHHDPKQDKTFATQYIKKVDGSGHYREIGQFVYHPAHSHWHVGNYVRYELWTIKDTDQKGNLMTSTGKQSFCIWDERVYDQNLPDAVKSRFYTNACSRGIQGMSIGWSDTYLARIEGQEINIADVPDGQYLLTFEVNPDRKILEGNYDNNADWLKIDIKGNKLTSLGKNQ